MVGGGAFFLSSYSMEKALLEWGDIPRCSRIEVVIAKEGHWYWPIESLLEEGFLVAHLSTINHKKHFPRATIENKALLMA